GLLAAGGLGHAWAAGVDGLLIETAPPDLRNRALALAGAGLMFTQGAGFALWGTAGQYLPVTVVILLAATVGVFAAAILPPGGLEGCRRAAPADKPKDIGLICALRQARGNRAPIQDRDLGRQRMTEPGTGRTAGPVPGSAGEPGGDPAGIGAAGEFTGLAALVTGGAPGIGLATARMLADRGARVAVLDRNAADGGDGLVSVIADVTNDEAVRRAVGEAVAALGGLDVLVNNAGIGATGTVEENLDAEWHQVL